MHAFDWREEHESNCSGDLFPLSVVQTELRRAVLNRSGPEFKQGIEVRVLRGSSSQPSLLRITPEMREGQGHLGCRIIPLNIRCSPFPTNGGALYLLTFPPPRPFILKPYFHLSFFQDEGGWQ